MRSDVETWLRETVNWMACVVTLLRDWDVCVSGSDVSRLSELWCVVSGDSVGLYDAVL